MYAKRPFLHEQERCGPGLTDKENSTCNAFENLAVDGGEGPYFGKEHPPGTAAARMSYMQVSQLLFDD